MNEQLYKSTPHEELMAQLMSENTAKTEREHAAKREIEKLHAEVLEQCRINGMGQERELKLMAEKRELLEALKFIAGHDLSNTSDRAKALIADFVVHRAEVAIAKARGEQQ